MVFRQKKSARVVRSSLLETLETRRLLTDVVGSLFSDNNYSGTHEANAGETSTPNGTATVYVDANNNGVLDAGETQTVASGGVYSLQNLAAGTYTLRAVAASGYVITSPAGNGALTVTVPSQLPSGQTSVAGGDFGIAVTPAAGSISGFMYADADGSGGPSTGDWFDAFGSVFLDLNNDAVREAGEPLAVTYNNEGRFTFANLQPDTYTVRASGSYYALTTPATQAYTVTLGTAPYGSTVSSLPSAAVGLVFGFTTKASSGVVGFFTDTNCDGKFWDGEPTLHGGVGAYIDLNNDGQRQATETVIQDNDGYTLISGLTTGTYTVRPLGGTDYVPTTTSVSLTVPGIGMSTLGVQLGFISKSAGVVSGNVFRDDNNNGVKDAAETGINGNSNSTRIYLDANNDGMWDPNETSTFADTYGNYTLAGTPGAAVVRMVLPSAQFIQTAPANNAGRSVTLVAGTSVAGQDFGLVPFATISGIVGNDANSDGTIDNGETVLANVVIYLDANGNGQFDFGEKSVSSASNGYYVFGNLLPGTYSVRQIVPATFRQVVPSLPAYTLTIAGGSNVAYFYDTNTGGASVSGTAYNDANGDGLKQAAEAGVRGTTIWDDADNDGQIDSNEQQATTDANGNYTLQGLPAGLYHLRAFFFSNQVQTSPGAAGNTVNLSTGQAATGINFGAYPLTPAMVSGVMFDDVNANGVQDAGEVGTAGATVYIDANDNDTLDAGEITALTNSTGYYFIGSLVPGNYTVREVVPSGYRAIAPGTASYAITLAAGTTTANFANTPVPLTGTIEGIAFGDTDGNGVKGSTETGLAGALVYVDANNNGRLDAGESNLVTVANGLYSFIGQPSGAFHLRITPPPGYVAAAASINGTLGSGQTLTGQNFALAVPVAGITLQAESAVLTGGTAAATNHANYTGTGFADFGGSGSAAQFSVSESTAAAATLTFRYANGGSTARPLSVVVNGVAIGSVACAPTSSWDTWSTVSISADLIAGANTIKAVAGVATGGNVDSLTITTGSTPPVTPPVTPPATSASLAGYTFNDSNASGKLDSGESKAGGKTVFLDTNNNGKLDAGEKSVVTGNDGSFTFAGLAAGTYHVRRVFPTGYTYSTTLIDLVLAAGQTVGGLTIGSKTA